MRSCVVLTLLSLLSCHGGDKQCEVIDMIKYWNNKQIQFPSNIQFTSLGQEVPSLLNKKWDYAIVSYTDSLGCTSCKLQLKRWKMLISKKEEIKDKNVEVLLFLHPSSYKDILTFLKDEHFDYPVCIDMNDSFNHLNKIPVNDMAFQTFLLDKNNRIIAIGNPAYNSKIEDLYFNIIKGKPILSTNSQKTSITTVSLPSRLLKLGTFPWQQPQTATFSFKNTGTLPLVIQDVSTSCGCTTVEYDPKPVQPGGSLDIQVTYKAEHPEHFDKTVTVYCNAEDSPIVLKIQGNAE